VKTLGWQPLGSLRLSSLHLSSLRLGSLLMLTVLVGCSPGSRLIGKWEVDTAKIQPAEGVSNPLAAMTSGMLSMVKFQTEFNADGKYAMTFGLLGQERAERGTWRYDRSEGSDLFLKIKTSSIPSEQELRIHFTDTDHFEMIPPGAGSDGQTMPFKRVAESP
jgi:hypothetical protein